MSTPSGSLYSPAASDHSTCCFAQESMFVVSGAPLTTRCESARIWRFSMGTPRRAMRNGTPGAGSASSNLKAALLLGAERLVLRALLG